MERHELTPLQNKLLDMLKWIDNFCRKNNLRYYVIGGTMLGAARHQGFIPWDDDIDICMPRKDYEKLAQLLGSTIHGKYVLETPKTINKDFCYPYAKMYDVTTTLIENYRVPLKRGIFIDIFQLDGMGNDEEIAKKYYLKQRKKYNFYISRVAAIRPERSKLKNNAIRVVRMIPNSIIDNCEYRISLDDISGLGDSYTSEWVTYLYGNWGVREVLPSRIFGSPIDYQFENIMVYGVTCADEYLTRVYGDWRTLPPEEKRITHHDYLLLDLNHSYLE